MISITGRNNGFLLRVGGVLLNQNKILLQKAKNGRGWVLPGGRSEVNEQTAATVIREYKEELNTEINVSRLLWVIENFNAYGISGVHELGFYYLVEAKPKANIFTSDDEFEVFNTGQKLVFKWFYFDELNNIHLFPRFLSTGLHDLTDCIQHVVNNDLVQDS